MEKPVIWRDPALDDLREIELYIAEDDPEAAERFVDKVWLAAESLQNLAERGRRVPELPHPDYRELLLGNYRLLYRLYPDSVEIAALLHGRRDFLSAWRSLSRE